MKEEIYFKNLKVKSLETILDIFYESIIDTNRTYDFFVDWKKIRKKLNDKEMKLEIKLNLLNSLIGGNNFDEKFRTILYDYPEVLPIIPLLIAVRDITFPVIADFYSEKIDIEMFDFTERKLSKTEIENFLNFVDKTGLKLFFTELANRSLVDYYLGIEVGMDTNARKNRSGEIMEKIINHHLDDISKKQNYPFSILKQKSFENLEIEFNFPVNSDIKNRKADFIILKDFKKPINIEVNFYTGSGSKPQEIVDAYIQRQSELALNNIEFIWITDGYGWKEQRNQTEKGFKKINYLLNIDFVKKGLLEDIINNI
ncbi:MAG: type II restriction endonuclease [Candidatus Heimdallarchaeota archaeon]|nr:type II restriction endonuclease [Candidatus Heimdallarchaeota archaeon]